jgi:uncharacterized membrane protein
MQNRRGLPQFLATFYLHNNFVLVQNKTISPFAFTATHSVICAGLFCSTRNLDLAAVQRAQ